MENPQLRVSIEPDTGVIEVMEKTSKTLWRQSPDAGKRGQTHFRNPRWADPPARGFAFDLPFGPGGANQLQVVLSLPNQGADLAVEIDMANRRAPVENIYFLAPFVLDAPEMALVVADYCNGHLYPLNLKPFPRTWFNLWQIDMPWVGLCDLEKGVGCALIVETDDDAFVQIQKTQLNGREYLGPRVGWQPSQRVFGHPRRYFYHFSAHGGYVALAKRFRDYAKSQGLILTFKEKLKKNPSLARIFGAPDVWGDSSLAFAKAAQAAGVEKMIIHGEASAADMQAINNLGYLTSVYDNYTDIFSVEPGKGIDATHGKLPDDAVLKADGQRMTAWLTWDKKQYMKRCPALWVPAAKAVIPPALEKRPYLGRFIDVTTAEELYECFDPNHPLTRTEKRQRGVDLLSYARSLGLVMGGEHGRYWAVPQLDYIEGMMSGGSYSWPAGHLLRPKTKDQEFTHPSGYKYSKWEEYEKWGIGHAYRVPLWELVFHDCIVSTWYWGDSSDFLQEAAPEVTPKKDAFNVLYGTIPILWANKEGGWRKDREAFLRTYRATCKLHEMIADAEMVSHEFLTKDRAVQRSKFSDGTAVIVNFGKANYEAKVGRRRYVLPQNGFAVKGPRIEQSLSLVDGKPVLAIKTKSFQFSDGQRTAAGVK